MQIVFFASGQRRETNNVVRVALHCNNFNKARNLIHGTYWESLLQGPISGCVLRWQQTFLTIMKECIPRRALPNKLCTL